MKYWPVPNSYLKKTPEKKGPVSFWENRNDRHHCGIDIYASVGSEVISVEEGKVVDAGFFSSPEMMDYWNITYYIPNENITGSICKYAELGNINVNIGELVKAGKLIGNVGLVLNSKKIDKTSPLYIQNIKKNQNLSMLHFELYNKRPKRSKKYLGGNWYGSKKPENLLDPTPYLISLS